MLQKLNIGIHFSARPETLSQAISVTSRNLEVSLDGDIILFLSLHWLYHSCIIQIVPITSKKDFKEGFEKRVLVSMITSID